MKIPLLDIQTGFEGFRRILEVEERFAWSVGPEDEISMDLLQWVDANMCAPLGAIFQRHLCRGKRIRLTGISADPVAIMRKNGFLRQFGLSEMRDRHGTTIQYHQFRREDRDAFAGYITPHFRHGNLGLPKMSEALLRKFRESLFEIYENAVEHSETKLGIFACGQFFPKKERLDFSIADLGIGIGGTVGRYLGREVDAIGAIKWAMKGNTTRTGRRPGGLGLKLIQEFVNLNKGRIIVVSNEGYWEFSNERANVNRFPQPFPGTVVTIEINTADTSSYRLRSEVDPNSIF